MMIDDDGKLHDQAVTMVMTSKCLDEGPLLFPFPVLHCVVNIIH